MKRILLICSLLVAATYTVTYAQAQQAPQTVPAPRPQPVSKSDFSSKINDLDNLIGKGKIEDAKTSLNEIDQLLATNFRANKYKMRDARMAKDDAAASNIDSKIRNQWAIYNELSNWTGNLTANRTKVIDMLNQIAATLD